MRFEKSIEFLIKKCDQNSIKFQQVETLKTPIFNEITLSEKTLQAVARIDQNRSQRAPQIDQNGPIIDDKSDTTKTLKNHRKMIPKWTPKWTRNRSHIDQ